VARARDAEAAGACFRSERVYRTRVRIHAAVRVHEGLCACVAAFQQGDLALNWLSDAMNDRPYFLWDVPVSDADLRSRLHDPDPDIRAHWQARIMREARFDDVWSYLTLKEILEDWPDIQRHLGRRRSFWEFLLQGWRADGLVPCSAGVKSRI
jgi:hypothetical protein